MHYCTTWQCLPSHGYFSLFPADTPLCRSLLRALSNSSFQIASDPIASEVNCEICCLTFYHELSSDLEFQSEIASFFPHKKMARPI